MVGDGLITLGPQPFLDTVARDWFLLASSMSSLTPPHLRLVIDMDCFISAFSLVENNGESTLGTTPTAAISDEIVCQPPVPAPSSALVVYNPTPRTSVLPNTTIPSSIAPSTTLNAAPSNAVVVYKPTPWTGITNNIVDVIPRLIELEEFLYNEGSYTPSVFLKTREHGKYQFPKC